MIDYRSSQTLHCHTKSPGGWCQTHIEVKPCEISRASISVVKLFPKFAHGTTLILLCAAHKLKTIWQLCTKLWATEIFPDWSFKMRVTQISYHIATGHCLNRIHHKAWSKNKDILQNYRYYVHGKRFQRRIYATSSQNKLTRFYESAQLRRPYVKFCVAFCSLSEIP